MSRDSANVNDVRRVAEVRDVTVKQRIPRNVRNASFVDILVMLKKRKHLSHVVYLCVHELPAGVRVCEQRETVSRGREG